LDLSELRPGIRVAGILASGPVEVVAVVPHGQDTVEVVFRSDDGNTGQRLIDRSYEARLEALDSDRERIGWRIEEAKARLGEARSDSEHRFLEGRLAALSGGVAVIKVGGATEIEIKEKCFRIEDALNATRAAMEEGTVPGGGVALLNAADALADMASDGDDEAAGIRAVRKALEAPIRRIAENAGLEGSVIVDGVRRRQRSRKNPSFGFNVVGERYVDMRKANIIDPAKVVCSALLNAASVSSMVLTVGALVAELPEDAPPESGA
jgi:chaperonin GroEL